MGYVLAGLGELDSRSQLSAAEAVLSGQLRPVYPAIDRVIPPPYLDANWKNRLKATPITALLELFRPFENVAVEIIVEATRLSKKPTRIIGGVTQDMRVDLPGDEVMDATTRATARRMRIVACYMTLVYQDSAVLARAIANVAAKYGARGADLVKFAGQEAANWVQQNLPGVPTPSAPPAPPAPKAPPPPPSKPHLFGLPANSLQAQRMFFAGLGVLPAVPAVVAQALEKMAEAKATITSIALASAPFVVPAIIALILGFTRQASTDVQAQKQRETAVQVAQAQQQAAAAQARAAAARSESSSAVPLLTAVAAGLYLLFK